MEKPELARPDRQLLFLAALVETRVWKTFRILTRAFSRTVKVPHIG